MRRTNRYAVTFSLTLLLTLSSAAALWAQDPGTPGPLAVTVQEYNFGDTAFSPPSGFPGPVEVRAQVHRPTSLAGGPFPLVIFLHGRHATCFSGGSAFLEWPCSAGRATIPSFQGYAYVASILASHGYIVVSISANGINAVDNSTFDLGMQARAELLQHHANIWNGFNTTGGAPFGMTFVGRVDMDNVGTMGHSRGGEGVMRHVQHNRSLGSPYSINAVFPLAPVNFHRPIIDNVPFDVLLPYCDGDVADLQGAHYYDDARYATPGDTAPKHTVLVMGTNHNFYNTVWTPGFGFPASDDWGFRDPSFSDPFCGSGPGNGRLTAAGTRGTGIAFMTGFFRLYLGGETAFAPIFNGDAPPPPSAMTSAAFHSYHAPDTATSRRDVNRLLDAVHLTTNHLGGTVSQSGLSPYELCGGELPQPQHCLLGQPTSRQPHTTPSARSSARGLSQLHTGWSGSATFTNNLPAGARNVGGFKVVQFRAVVDFTDFRNPPGMDQDFRVRLTDGAGATADALVSSHSPVLFYPPGGPAVTPLPKVVLNTIRLPLSAFSGVNLSDIRSVQFRFNQTPSGGLLLTDLAFADPSTPAVPPDLVVSALSNPPPSAPRGTSFPLSITTTNQGGGAVTVVTYTRVYLSADAVKDASDKRMGGQVKIVSLAAGASFPKTKNFRVKGTQPPGEYFVIACADALNAVAEGAAGEANNCRTAATKVTITP